MTLNNWPALLDVLCSCNAPVSFVGQSGSRFSVDDGRLLQRTGDYSFEILSQNKPIAQFDMLKSNLKSIIIGELLETKDDN